MTTVTAETKNPLLIQDGLPLFESIEASHLTPAVETLLAQLQTDLTAFETQAAACATPTYENVLPEIERMQFALNYAWGVAGHLNGVKNSDELREAYQKNQPKIVEVYSKFNQSQALYNALSQLKLESDDSFEALQKKRAVELSLRGMTLGGVALEGAQKERFNEIKTRLAELSTNFSNNVLDETKAFSYTITDPKLVEGVPNSSKALWANAHIASLKDKDGKPELNVEQGPWRITLDYPSLSGVMRHIRDRSVREKVYRANITKASADDKNNTPIIYEILQLKHELAQLLGYENYAQVSLAKKMAPSIEAIKELASLIASKALPAAEEELQEMTQLALTMGGPQYNDLAKLEPWDIMFWSERLKELKFQLTEEETRPYFALPAVLQGLFGLIQRLFGARIEAADGSTQVWHPDVRFFKMFDNESDSHIASFYLDPYSRPENKRGGAWMNDCIGKSAATEQDVPVAYLTCNGSPPVGDKPSLMTFREVETLFHETGHGLQHMLTKATVGDVAGINGVEWDAVELPSQFLENWCYDRPTVYGFAKHWETGEPMPEEIFEKLCAQKTFNAGMLTCRQLNFGQLDMELHSNFDASQGEQGPESIFDVQRRLAEKFTPFNMPLPEDRFLCAFSHIFAGGYSAGYYSYIWAEVMSADAFSAFEDVGLANEEKVKGVGLKFRDTVLALGGGVDPMTVFKRFRGREPTPDALLRHKGLA